MTRIRRQIPSFTLLLSTSLALTGSQLFAADLDVSQSPLIATENGRKVLEYTIECALPEGATAFADTENGRVTFAGGMGIAPLWTEKPLTTTQRSAVSACLLARTNAFGVSVQISLRSQSEQLRDLPAFQADAEERARFGIWEGRFFGDILSDPPQAFACRGDISNEVEAALRNMRRVCTLPVDALANGSPAYSQCGFEVFSSCAEPDALAALARFGGSAIDVYVSNNAAH